MNDNIIPNEEAGLLLHRYVSEQVPILALFISADMSIEAKLSGYLSSATRARGFVIAAKWPDTNPGVPMPSFLRLGIADDVWYDYSDETESPAELLASGFGSTLRVNWPNGNTLYIVETRPTNQN